MRYLLTFCIFFHHYCYISSVPAIANIANIASIANNQYYPDNIFFAINHAFQEMQKGQLKNNEIIDEMQKTIRSFDHDIFIPMYNFDFKIDKQISVKGYVENVTLSKLYHNVTVNVNNNKTKNLVDQLSLSVPTLVLDGTYQAVASIGNNSILIYGNGSFRFDLYNIHFNITNILEKDKESKINTRDVDFDFTFDNATVKIKGLFNDDEVSETISETISNILPQFAKEVKPHVYDYGKTLLKLYLTYFT